MRNGNGGGGGFFFGFLVGAAIGGAAAVLLLQEETRDTLLGKVNDATSDIRGKVNEATSQWQSNAADLYARGKQVVDDARSTIDSAVQEGKAAATQARDEIKWRKEV